MNFNPYDPNAFNPPLGVDDFLDVPYESSDRERSFSLKKPKAPKYRKRTQSHEHISQNRGYDEFSEADFSATTFQTFVPQQPSSSSHVFNPIVFISLELSAENLRNEDFLGVSDPMCVVQQPANSTIQPGIAPSNVKWVKIDSTDTIRNDLNPKWTKRIRIPFFYNLVQKIRFYVIDVDDFQKNTGDFLGCCESNVNDIYHGVKKEFPLTNIRGMPLGKSKLIVRVHDENAQGQMRLKLSLAGKNLPNARWLQTSHPFFNISYTLPQNENEEIALYNSEVIRRNLDPQWKPQTLILPMGNFSQREVSLKISVYDGFIHKSRRLIGTTETTLDKLANAPPRMSLPLRHPGKKRAHRGELQVIQASVSPCHSFLSYLDGGLELRFVIAVDFTTQGRFLHPPTASSSVPHVYYENNTQHQEEFPKAIESVASVVHRYRKDESVSALGFGAKFPDSPNAIYDFALNGKLDSIVSGKERLAEAYYQALNYVSLSGPTNYAPVISNAAKRCCDTNDRPILNQTKQQYTILVIITHGQIEDYAFTIDAIEKINKTHPLCIVFLGVGNLDMTKLEHLESDDKNLTYKTVRFVKYNRSTPDDMMAAQMMRDLPHLISNFMMDKNISPNTATPSL